MNDTATIEDSKKNSLASVGAALRQRWRAWFANRPPRDLRLCESLTLGDKRFVAVVGVGGRRYLVGGTASSLTLLSELPAANPAPNSLAETR